ncbi:helix-turn-helix domain-containing protein [Parabacteroides sp.]
MEKRDSILNYHTGDANDDSFLQTYQDGLTLLTLDKEVAEKYILFPVETKPFTVSILIVTSGSCDIYINYRPYHVEKSMFIVFRKEVLISNATFSENFAGSMIMVNLDFMRTAIGTNIFPAKELFARWMLCPTLAIPTEDFERVIVYLKQLKEALSLPSHLYQLGLIQNAFSNINLELWNITAQASIEQIQQNHTPTLREKLTFQFIHMVQKESRTEHEVAYYARQLNVSAAHLTRVLGEVTGKTASQWIAQILLNEVKLLLHYPSNSIQFIASETHFSDQASLCKFFKKNTGMSPLEYRRKVIASSIG